jgi:DNA repair photolyase
LNRKSNGKMFNIVTGTWNPVSGCLYGCSYCWARDFAVTKLRNSHRYSNGFKPMLNETEFRTKFGEGDVIFVSDMGDLFGSFVPDDWIIRVLKYTSHFPKTSFLFMTKNPARYLEFRCQIPENAILGVTIETNIDNILKAEKISQAPLPSERFNAMRDLNWERKLLSIEPILDFDLRAFAKWVEDIFPLLVYVGYDNYGHNLNEPLETKTLELIDRISEDTLVIRKTIRPSWREHRQRSLVQSYRGK